MDASVLKSNGMIKLTSNQAGISERDKEKLLLCVDKEVCSYGLRLFFCIIHDNKIEYIVKNAHLSLVEEAIDHHNS